MLPATNNKIIPQPLAQRDAKRRVRERSMPQSPHYRHIPWPDNDFDQLSLRILELVRDKIADLPVMEPRSTQLRQTISPVVIMAKDLPG
jgi:hypothetical protein